MVLVVTTLSPVLTSNNFSKSQDWKVDKDLSALRLFYNQDIEHGTDARCLSHMTWSAAQEIQNNEETFKGTDVVLTRLFANKHKFPTWPLGWSLKAKTLQIIPNK